MTFGLLRPAILLPAAAEAWPESRLRSVLTHELAHIRRRDVLTQSIAYAICLLFWFLPPLWLAYGFIVREAETCCDQQVINRGIRRSEYARDIVDLVRASQGHILLPVISNTMGRKSMLKERIGKTLSLRLARLAGGARGVVKLLAIGLFYVVPIMAVTAQANPVQLKADDPLVGTWINAKYEGHLYLHAKLIFFPDGRELGFDHLSSPEPDCEHWFTIDETWVDEEGNHWYKFHGTWVLRLTKQEGPYYCLSKINASGTVREWVWSQVDYPEELSPVGGFSYSTYYRQEQAPSPDGDVFLISPND